MATSVNPVLLTGGINPENFYGVYLTGGAFNFLDVKPLIGRTIQPFDIGPGGRAGACSGAELWVLAALLQRRSARHRPHHHAR